MKVVKMVVVAVAVLMICAAPVFAQAPPNTSYSFAGGGIGAGYGFGRIGSAALESMARQPEVAGRVGTNMLIIAALLEGATFFSLIVCILVNSPTTRPV